MKRMLGQKDKEGESYSSPDTEDISAPERLIELPNDSTSIIYGRRRSYYNYR